MFEGLDFRFVETSSDWEAVAKVRTANHCARNVGRQQAHRMPLRSDCCSMPKNNIYYDTAIFVAMTRWHFRCTWSGRCTRWHAPLSAAGSRWPETKVQSCIHLIPVCLTDLGNIIEDRTLLFLAAIIRAKHTPLGFVSFFIVPCCYVSLCLLTRRAKQLSKRFDTIQNFWSLDRC